jgi:putative oxidoreductase
MSELATFQLAFAAAIGRQSRHRDALESQPGFAVYRNTIPNALIEALRGHYPVTDEIVGPEAFNALAFDYSRRHPPPNSILLRYGAGFADFLATQPWIDEVPYLPDVARLERLWTEAHVAADAEPLAMGDVAALGADRWLGLRLPLHPAARFAWLSTPALTIWQAHRAQGGFEKLAPDWRAEGALLTRPAGEVRALPIDAPAHLLLSGLRVGESVRGAAAAVARLYPQADFTRLFAALVATAALPGKELNMATLADTPATARHGPLSLFARLAGRALPLDLILLVQRIGIAAIFFQSGRTKVEGLFTLSESTFFLFENDYAGVPLLAPVQAAYAATIAEHAFPVLLVLGLLSRLSATALLGMTLVIQLFVYPDAWPTHLSWAGLLLPIIAFGGGRFAVDRLVRIP